MFSIGSAFAQEITPDSVKVSINTLSNPLSFVFETKNSPDVAFNNAKQWIAKNFQDYKKTIQMEEVTGHTLMFKGKESLGTYNGLYKSYRTSHKLMMDYTATVECKEGRFRIKIEDLDYSQVLGFTGQKDVVIKIKMSTLEALDDLKKDSDQDSSYISMLENLVPKTKETIAAIVNSMAKSISYYDDF